MRIQRLMLSLVLGSLLLTSCGKKDRGGSSGGYTPAPEPDTGDFFDDLDLGEGEDYKLSDEELKFRSNQDYDVSPNYKIEIKIKSETNELTYNSLKTTLLGSSLNLSTLVDVEDRNGNTFDMVAISASDEHGEYFLISPSGGETYKEGAIISCKLKDNSLQFRGRDESIKELFFNVPKGDSSYFAISKDVPFFDIGRVMYFPILNGEYPDIEDPKSQEAIDFFNNATYYFGYASEIKLDVDQHFGISLLNNGEVDLSNENTFYGKFVKCEKDGDIYKVTFKNADLTKIFKDDKTGDVAFNFHQKDLRPQLKQTSKVTEKQKEELKEKLFKTDDFRLLTRSIAENTGNGLPEILSLFDIDLKVETKDNGINIQFKVGGLIPVGKPDSSGNKPGAIRIGITFQWTIAFQCEGDVEISTAFGIPYDIDATGKVTKITDMKLKFQVSWMKRFTPEENEKDMYDRIKDSYDKLKADKDYFKPRTDDPESISANHISQDLIGLEIPFGYVFSFKLTLSLEFTLDLNVMLEYGYTSHTAETILSFDTDNGVKNTTNSTEASATSHSIDLGGTLYIALGPQITISIGIVGLRKIFQIGGSVFFGIYFELKAMGGVAWGDGQSTHFYGGFEMQMGFVGTVKVFLDFLFIIHWEYDFGNAKWPWFSLDTGTSIMDIMADDSIELTQYETHTDETNLLVVRQFSTKDFAIDLHAYRTYDRVTYDDEQIQPVYIQTSNQYITIDEASSKIIVDPNAPAEFDATFEIWINKNLVSFVMTSESSKTITVHFRSATAKKLYLGEGDSNFKLLEPGKEFKLPNVSNDKSLDKETKFTNFEYTSTGSVNFAYHVNLEVYDFLSYSDGLTNYQPGDTFTMPDNDVRITVNLFEIVYYNVTFYNGNNVPIKVAKTREYTAAIPPTDEEIAMEGYAFYGWDRDFSYITEDINVYGIYLKWSEGGLQ